jgi:esterase/lipase superfamily enzyme
MDERTERYLEQVDAAWRTIQDIPMPDADSPASGFADAAAEEPIAAIPRTARAIVEYVMSASRRPRASDATLQLAFPLSELWARPALAPDEVLSRSLITVQAFARTAETQSPAGDLDRVRMLREVSAALREATARIRGDEPVWYVGDDAPWYAHLREGDRWGDVLGYQAVVSAARAETVWRAMDELRIVLEGGDVEFPALAPEVPATPLLPTPSTALQEYDDLDLSAAWQVEPDTSPRKHADDTVEVWFGTTRALRPGTTSEFGPERSPELLLGQCYVFVPEAHRRGSSGSGWAAKLLRLDFRDDTLKLQKTVLLGDGFSAALSERLDDIGSRRALLFVHGYSSPFEGAIVCAAQLAVDLDTDGVVAAFAWPSRASKIEYIPDLSQAESAWERLVEFIGRLRAAGVEQLDVVVHSMGNRVLSWAMERLAGEGASIDHLYLAAADMDPDILRQRSGFYRTVCRSITSYASTADRALGLSRVLHGTGRVGLLPPVTVIDGITTIDASEVDDTFIGHGYFVESSAVLDDIRSDLQNVPPVQRKLYQGQGAAASTHWTLHR